MLSSPCRSRSTIVIPAVKSPKPSSRALASREILSPFSSGVSARAAACAPGSRTHADARTRVRKRTPQACGKPLVRRRPADRISALSRSGNIGTNPMQAMRHGIAIPRKGEVAGCGGWQAANRGAARGCGRARATCQPTDFDSREVYRGGKPVDMMTCGSAPRRHTHGRNSGYKNSASQEQSFKGITAA